MITIITNRKQILYTDLVTHLKKCGHQNVERIILREKDLSPEKVSKKIKQIKACKTLKRIPLLLNGPYPLEETYGADGRQYTMAQFEALTKRPAFLVGVSVHSLEEIGVVNNHSVDYVLYGHIFTTACKVGLKERGLDNLKLIIEASKNPVVALGGIGLNNYKKLYDKGCSSFAMMSSVMRSQEPMDYLSQFDC